MLNSSRIRSDFPILSRRMGDHQLVYLDSAATSQKPQAVIDAISNYYTQHNANVHRGVHMLSDESTSLWHESRTAIASFFGARDEQLVITRNATEALNLAAYGWADHNVGQGDVILSTVMEHHANLVVWQQVCARTGAQLELIPVLPSGVLDDAWLAKRLRKNDVRLVALTHVSNVLGTLNPIEKIAKQVRAAGAVLVVDGAQSAPHMPINFNGLGADFFAFSGHKMLGPMGVGGLLVNSELFPKTQYPVGAAVPLPKGDGLFYPALFGGGMISEVSSDYTRFNDDPQDRYTAGTPDVASVVGLAAACEYLQKIGMAEVLKHDQHLVQYALEKLCTLPEVTIVGPDLAMQKKQHNRIGAVTFLFKGVHSHDVAQVLSSEGIAVRSGHHCAMPLHTHFDWIATTRASFQVYSTTAEIDALVRGLEKVKKVLG